MPQSTQIQGNELNSPPFETLDTSDIKRGPIQHFFALSSLTITILTTTATDTISLPRISKNSLQSLRLLSTVFRPSSFSNLKPKHAMASHSSGRRNSSHVHANLNRPRRVPNTYRKRKEFSTDDPPSVRPEGYKSPYKITREGDEIEVWWEGSDRFYRGTVRNPRGDGKRRVEYDDGQVLYHLLSREVYTLAGAALERVLAERYGPDARRHTNGKRPILYPGLVDFLRVGHRVKIYWPRMKAWYDGTVTTKDASGRFSIAYDDGDKQRLRMENEIFRFIEESAVVVHTCLIDECLEL